MENETAKIEQGRMSRLNQARASSKLNSGMMLQGGRMAADFATGGAGKVLRKGAERQTREFVAGMAGKAAASYMKNKGQGGGKSESEKMQGAGFWFIFGIVCIKEIMDVFLDMTIILSFLAIITGALVSFAVYFYLKMEGVSLEKNRLAVWLVSILIEIIPFLNILPTFPITLLVLRKMETSEFLQSKMKLAEGLV